MSTTSLLGSFCGGGICMVIGIWAGAWFMMEEKKRKIKRAQEDWEKFLKFWRCSVCELKRPDEKIDVVTHDVSDRYNCPETTVVRNVRYCNDHPSCMKVAHDKDYWKQKHV